MAIPLPTAHCHSHSHQRVNGVTTVMTSRVNINNKACLSISFFLTWGEGVIRMSCNSKRNVKQSENTIIHQCRKNKISTSAGKTKYPPVQEKQTIHQCREKTVNQCRKKPKNKLSTSARKKTIHQCRKNELSASAGKTNYPPVQEKQTIHQCRKSKLRYPPEQRTQLFCIRSILNCQSLQNSRHRC